MLNWYVFALLGFSLIGLQRFLYKVAANRGHSPSRATFSFMLTVALISGIIYILRPTPLASPWLLLLFAVINSASFVSATLSHIRALHHIPASVAYPVIRMNILLVLLFSVIALSERLSQVQWMGVGLSLLALLFLSGIQVTGVGGKASSRYRKGWAQLGLATVSGAAAAISCKLAADLGNLLAFIAISYACSTFLTWLGAAVSGKEETEVKSSAGPDWLGVGMGLLNLAGFYCYLRALSMGPLSIVASINGMHFVVAVVLSVIIYRERLTWRSLAGVGASAVALVLLKGS